MPAPVSCSPWVNLINKFRQPDCFSRVAVLQSWMSNTGRNFLDTACFFFFFLSCVKYECICLEQISDLLTLLADVVASACMTVFEMFYKEVGWYFYHFFFFCSLVVLGFFCTPQSLVLPALSSKHFCSRHVIVILKMELSNWAWTANVEHDSPAVG